MNDNEAPTIDIAITRPNARRGLAYSAAGNVANAPLLVWAYDGAEGFSENFQEATQNLGRMVGHLVNPDNLTATEVPPQFIGNERTVTRLEVGLRILNEAITHGFSPRELVHYLGRDNHVLAEDEQKVVNFYHQKWEAEAESHALEEGQRQHNSAALARQEAVAKLVEIIPFAKIPERREAPTEAVQATSAAGTAMMGILADVYMRHEILPKDSPAHALLAPTQAEVEEYATNLGIAAQRFEGREEIAFVGKHAKLLTAAQNLLIDAKTEKLDPEEVDTFAETMAAIESDKEVKQTIRAAGARYGKAWVEEAASHNVWNEGEA